MTATEPAKIIRHEPDLLFSIVAEPHAYCVEFKIYDMIEVGSDGKNFSWPRIGAEHGMDVVTRLEWAEVYLSGSVKWDGCSNWHFDEQDRCMLHACSREGLLRLGEVMALCWDWTAELCPNWWTGE